MLRIQGEPGLLGNDRAPLRAGLTSVRCPSPTCPHPLALLTPPQARRGAQLGPGDVRRKERYVPSIRAAADDKVGQRGRLGTPRNDRLALTTVLRTPMMTPPPAVRLYLGPQQH